MGKKIIVGIDNFAQSGETTLREITAAAAAQSGNAAEVVRDPSTGKVIQVVVNLPDSASQSAIDTIANNKGAAGSLTFPAVLLDENFDSVTLGQLPVNDAEWLWFGIAAASTDQSVSAPNSMKMLGVLPQERLRFIAVGTNTTFLVPGRTIEVEFKIRFAVNTGFQLLTVGASDLTLFMDAGDLKFNKTLETVVASGLAVDAFHTIKYRYLIGSDTLDITVNGVPKGLFSSGVGFGAAWTELVIEALAGTGLTYIDDLKVTAVA